MSGLCPCRRADIWNASEKASTNNAPDNAKGLHVICLDFGMGLSQNNAP